MFIDINSASTRIKFELGNTTQVINTGKIIVIRYRNGTEDRLDYDTTDQARQEYSRLSQVIDKIQEGAC